MSEDNPYGNFTLELKPTTSKRTGWQTFEMSTTSTSASSVRGSAISGGYLLQPILWVNQAVDAAKERMAFLDVASEYILPEGHKDLIVPIRKKYIARGSWETSAAEYAAGSQIPQTNINNVEGVQFTPVKENYLVGITTDAVRTSQLNLLTSVREDLSYKYEDLADTAISTAMYNATAMSNSVNGMQTIFGGDATDLSNSLNAGSILTTDLIAKARRLLMSDKGYYWANGNVFTKSAVTKNAWQQEASKPFVLFIAPEQEEGLLKDPQFVNAAEYGSNTVVLNGEIGSYLGVKVVNTTKVPAFSASDTIVLQGGTTTMDVAGHQCFLVKAKTAVGITYGLKPQLTVFEYQVEDKLMVKLGLAQQAKAIHNDAIVRIVVADE